MAPGHQDDIFTPILLIDHRRRLTAGGERLLPEDFAGPHVDGLEQIVRRRRDEDQAAGRNDRTAIIWRTDANLQSWTMAPCRRRMRALPALSNRPRPTSANSASCSSADFPFPGPVGPLLQFGCPELADSRMRLQFRRPYCHRPDDGGTDRKYSMQP